MVMDITIFDILSPLEHNLILKVENTIQQKVICMAATHTRRDKLEDFGEFDESRWEIVKALLDEYPTLKEKVKTYIATTAN
jgi:inorganic pyrophosphatase